METKIEIAIGLLNTVKATRPELDIINAAIIILEYGDEEHAALVAVADAAKNVIHKNSALWSQSTIDCDAPQSTKNDFARAICDVNNALDQLDAVRDGE